MAVKERRTATVRVQHISQTVIAKDLLDFFESIIGKETVFACEILTERKNWKSRGHGRFNLGLLMQR